MYSDPTTLPPPDVLASLSLELIRCWALRTLHVAVFQALQGVYVNKSRTCPSSHQRANTETFLLRRTKQVALAGTSARRLERRCWQRPSNGSARTGRTLRWRARSREAQRGGGILWPTCFDSQAGRAACAAEGGLRVELFGRVSRPVSRYRGALPTPRLAIPRSLREGLCGGER